MLFCYNILREFSINFKVDTVCYISYMMFTIKHYAHLLYKRINHHRLDEIDKLCLGSMFLTVLTCTTDLYATVIKYTMLIRNTGFALQITNTVWKSVIVSRIKIYLLSSKQGKGIICCIGFHDKKQNNDEYKSLSIQHFLHLIFLRYRILSNFRIFFPFFQTLNSEMLILNLFFYFNRKS